MDVQESSSHNRSDSKVQMTVTTLGNTNPDSWFIPISPKQYQGQAQIPKSDKTRHLNHLPRPSIGSAAANREHQQIGVFCCGT